MSFAFLAWIIVGLIVGFIASKLVNLSGDTPILGIGASIGGAVVAGVLYAILSGRGFIAWDFWSLIVSGLGAIAAVGLYHAIRSRSITREVPTARSSY